MATEVVRGDKVYHRTDLPPYLDGYRLYFAQDLLARKIDTGLIERGGEAKIPDPSAFANSINCNGLSRRPVATLRQVTYIKNGPDCACKYQRIAYLPVPKEGDPKNKEPVALDRLGRFSVNDAGEPIYVDKSRLKHIWMWDKNSSYLQQVDYCDKPQCLMFRLAPPKWVGKIMPGAGGTFIEKNYFSGKSVPLTDDTLGLHGDGFASFLWDDRISNARVEGGHYEIIIPRAIAIVREDMLE